MTLAEANAEAQKRWGDSAGARSFRVPGKPNRYEVGVVSRAGRPHVFGAGATFDEAFSKADERGLTPEKVQRALAKADAKGRREEVAHAAKHFVAALGALFGGGKKA
jgi:hypothetical protein